MSFIDDAKSWATAPIPGPGMPDEQAKAFDAKPVAELAMRWQALQFLGIKDQTDESWNATLYFDHLPHNQPQRAFDLVLAVLQTETDMSVLLELGNRMFTTLVHHHANLLIDRIEEAARGNAKLRWLLGGAHWWASDDTIKERLAAIADEEAWRADRHAHATRFAPIDFPSLSLPGLARVWVDLRSRPWKDVDDNWHTLSDFERDLMESDPDRLIDLILEILKIETNAALLSYLAAGPLEDVIDERSIARIEREAFVNEAFRVLLGGVWYSSKPDDIRARLDAILRPGQ
jgi:hypothetical protein